MGLLQWEQFSKTPTFTKRFFEQKESKAEFVSNEKEFSARQRDSFIVHDISIAVETITIFRVPQDRYAFITNLNLSVQGSTIDQGDCAISIGPVVSGSTIITRLSCGIDSTGGRTAVSNIVYNKPIRLNPGDAIFIQNLVAIRINFDATGFLLDKKEVEREIQSKYG